MSEQLQTSNTAPNSGQPNRPSSDRRIKSSRENGRKSHGPTTPEGKARSSVNGIRHGMLAHTVCLDLESKERFANLVDDLLAEFQPATKSEKDLVETAAVARWNQMRIWGIRSTDLQREMNRQGTAMSGATPPMLAAAAFRDLADTGNSLALALRYETTYAREYKNCVRELNRLKHLRGPAVDTPAASHQFTSSTFDAPPESEPDLCAQLEDDMETGNIAQLSESTDQNVFFQPEPSPANEHSNTSFHTPSIITAGSGREPEVSRSIEPSGKAPVRCVEIQSGMHANPDQLPGSGPPRTSSPSRASLNIP
jgi:hypothetical protein